MRRAALLVIAGGLAACTPQSQDRLARDAARSTVNRVVLERYPNLPLGPAIDCTIENASAEQINALALDAVTGPTASSVQIVTSIVEREATVQCLATEYARAAGAIE